MTGSDQTDSPQPGYSRWRRIFGIAFLVSSVVGVLLLGALLLPPRDSSGAPRPTATVTSSGVPTLSPVPPPTPSGPDWSGAASTVAITASCLTSLTSLVGFAFTTVIGFRKERREAQSADLERQIRELELERQRLDLESRKRDRPADDEH